MARLDSSQSKGEKSDPVVEGKVTKTRELLNGEKESFVCDFHPNLIVTFKPSVVSCLESTTSHTYLGGYTASNLKEVESTCCKVAGFIPN